ncbi:SIS domain-containing protein [Streptomyces althioticus]|uniref:SIS domain-containing protein n=1 Tax=Actinomycetes TaxID=1760 RepID=UPI0005243D71|nr:SIS domain-containing protein [Actinospica acidiphila]ALV51496.1 mannose-6-phosphate isomerase [Streptomyces sp. 4F]WTB99407.1 mannose-6-phosphate isomerase [Streptomyces althioticus]GGQ72525.1 bifunctional glucose-6-phosphate/mannose-6-phosphate isomerase [Streptomyces griseorubens]GGT66647.1 bifunctional glucose-6-phosphate/mannose-6-phosphate isomerase [Streptomyces matensis]MBM4830452.1 mannose-6-phosphate isomerase [Actinospica acidiphila]
MLDESLLDSPEGLAEADHRALLRGAAEAGARVRTAARHAAEAGVGDLKPDGRPRAVLIAGPGAAATQTADLLGTLAGAGSPVTRLAPTGVAPAAGALRWELPGWAGSVDLLLIATPDGTEPGLSLLAEQAYRRGLTVVAVAPAGTPLAESVSGSHGLFVPMAVAPYDHDEPLAASAPGVLWALLTPLLALLDRTGLLTAPPDTLQKVADRLDAVAERCGPAVVTYSNAAKTLAAELADSLPVVWTEGVSAGPAGRRFAAALAELSGTPAVVAELPEALAAHSALLAGPLAAGADPDDFFRDRVEEAPALHARVVLLRDRPLGGLTAAPAARELALTHDTPISELEPEEGGELETLAELIAVTDFAAVYLALASAPR